MRLSKASENNIKSALFLNDKLYTIIKRRKQRLLLKRNLAFVIKQNSSVEGMAASTSWRLDRRASEMNISPLKAGEIFIDVVKT